MKIHREIFELFDFEKKFFFVCARWPGQLVLIQEERRNLGKRKYEKMSNVLTKTKGQRFNPLSASQPQENPADIFI